jgi:hypothetical protein
MNVSRIALRTTSTDLQSAGITSFIVVLPFLLESLRTAKSVTIGLPLFFGGVWLVQSAFLVAIGPVVRYARDHRATVNALSLSLRITVAGLLFALWTGWVVAQFPTFINLANYSQETAQLTRP